HHTSFTQHLTKVYLHIFVSAYLRICIFAYLASLRSALPRVLFSICFTTRTDGGAPNILHTTSNKAYSLIFKLTHFHINQLSHCILHSNAQAVFIDVSNGVLGSQFNSFFANE